MEYALHRLGYDPDDNGTSAFRRQLRKRTQGCRGETRGCLRGKNGENREKETVAGVRC